jgi:uncharacterized membrane protein YoaK (UPF0700 family)
VTGFATLAGISLGRGQVLETLGILSIPFYFLTGVMVSGYLTEKTRAPKLKEGRYGNVMALVALCLAAVAGLGYLHMFGEFDAPANLKHDYFLLALLCAACGLQNAAITSASGSTVRTTHLTGLTTDLGLGIIRAEIHHISPELRTAERKANWLRIGTIAAFTLGSIVGALFYLRFQYLGFLFPMMIAIYVALEASKTTRH